MKRFLIAILFLFLSLLTAAIGRPHLLAQDEAPVSPSLGEAPQNLPYSPVLREQEQSKISASSNGPAVAMGDQFTYLPFIAKPPVCSLNAQEQEIASLAINHPDQARLEMNCHPILARVARERALDLGTRNYFSHVNPDGYGPNYLVRQAGYELPSWWSTDPAANFIESIAGGYTTATSAWNGWLNSPGHRRHVLAEDDFWADQTNYGIGYAYVAGSKYKHYWVFISAPPEE